MSSLLKEASEVLEDYPRPNSNVDMGNLYFAATQYQEAYEDAVSRYTTAVHKHLDVVELYVKQKDQIQKLKAYITGIAMPYIREEYCSHKGPCSADEKTCYISEAIVLIEETSTPDQKINT